MVNADLDQPARGRFAGAEHRFPVRVYFEDTDAGGVVYHANYLRYMERARSDMLACAGIDQRGALDDGTGVYTIASLSIRYRRPAKLDDALLVRSRLATLRASTCVIRQQVTRDEELVADAEVTTAFVAPNGRPRRQPRAWIAAFESIQGESIQGRSSDAEPGPEHGDH